MISDYAGKTHKGLVKKINEDNWGVFPEQGLFLVADGIGGLPAGDIASKLVVEVLPPLLAQRIDAPEMLSRIEIIDRIKQSICDLSDRILHESQKRAEYAGMGTTIVMALLTESQMFIAHLGDSRAYLLKGDNLQQLSNDHSLIRHLLMSNDITQAQAKTHPGRNHLVQYVGMGVSPNPDVICLPRVSGERLLLCSDGLSNMLSNEEIRKFMRQFSSAEHTCNALITAANLAGGHDNVTVVLVD